MHGEPALPYSPAATRVWWLGILPVLAACAAVAVYYGLKPGVPRHPLGQGVYVWQYAWSPPVQEAVAQHLGAFSHALVFCAEVSAGNEGFTVQRAYPGWRAMGTARIPIWAVLRVRNSVTRKITSSADEVAAYLGQLAHAIADEASASSVALAGVQIDYDCPTRALSGYAALTGALHRALPGVPLSITALPTWLGQPALAEVVAPLVHFTLQVHSLDKPKRIDDAILLCDAPRIEGWLNQAARLQTPFYLALPTYTYRLYFTPTGDFAALGAEGAPNAPPEYTTRDARADPEAMAAVLRSLQSGAPAHCLGIQWFRLPVAGDTLNWSWPVLASVMQGVAPRAVFTAEVRTSKPGLHEVWLRNEGPHTPLGSVNIPLHWSGCDVAAEDALGDFHLDSHRDGAVALSGPPPAPGETRMAAWFRMACDNAQFNADPVELTQ